MIFVYLLLAMAAPQAPDKEKAMPARNEARIRELLRAVEFKQDVRDELSRLGGFSPVAFPLYVRILTDPKESSFIVQRTLGVLSLIKADRSQFLEYAVAKLADSHPEVRHAAVELLAQIGSARDAAPIVALLSDRDWTISIVAAKALAAIGDRRALAAMNVWLNSSSPRKDRNERFDETFRRDIAKYRDELKQRLEKAKKTKR